MSYYWLASYDFEPGTIINPGNWGRILKKYDFTGNGSNSKISREFIFESVRLRDYSHLPSRLECIFLLDDLQKAKEFQRERVMDIIYEVSVLDETADIFEADMGLTNFPINSLSVEGWILLAESYWSGMMPQGLKELLVLSKIQIVGKV